MSTGDTNQTHSDAFKRLVGQRLVRERTRRGWTQSMLAKELGVGMATINRWENGKTLPQLYYRGKLSALFQKPLEELFSPEEEAQQEEQAASDLQQPPDPTHPVHQPATRDQNRRSMLRKVWNTWIKGYLEQTGEVTPLLAPQLYESPDAVENLWQSAVQDFPREARPIPPGTTVEQIYYDDGEGLLLLGKAGAGKTALLLELARALLQQALEDDTLPIPVIFNLATWSTRRQPITRWLIQELKSKYLVPHELGKEWVEKARILPLLDGLDEVPAHHRAACVEAINYRQKRRPLPLVVCCREDEYRSLPVQLILRKAVVIHPLTHDQVDYYLASLGESLAPVLQALHQEPELYEIFSTPLMMKVIAAAYRDGDVADLLTEKREEVRRQRIFSAYVRKMLARRGPNRYPPPDVIRWLHWLACQLSRHHQNEFQIEQLQPDWLPDGLLRWLLPALAVGLVYGIFFGLIKGISYASSNGADQYGRAFTLGRGALDGLLIGLFNMLLFTLFNGLIPGMLHQQLQRRAANDSERSWQQHILGVLSSRPVYGLLNGLLNGLLIAWLIDPPAGIYNGLFVTVVYAALGSLPAEIRPMEALTWSWRPVRERILFFAGGGLLIGLIYGAATAMYWQMKAHLTQLHLDHSLPCLLFGLSIGCILGILLVLTRGLSATKLDERTFPNQGIWNSARNSALVAVVAWLLVGLFFSIVYGVVLNSMFHLFGITYAEYAPFFPKQSGLSIGLTYGLIVGAFFWLRCGGTACIQHLSLRIMLCYKKYTHGSLKSGRKNEKLVHSGNERRPEY